MKILIVKTSSLGDVIHCLPVINDIIAAHPNAQIDWVVEESFADIPRLHKGVNQVITVAFRRWRKQAFKAQTWAEIASFKKQMQQNQYDVVIDAQGLLKSALITSQAHGVKHGYDKQSIREPLASNFYHKKYAIAYQQHAVTRNRHLSALILAYAVPNNAPDYGISVKNDTVTSTLNNSLQCDYIIALHASSRDSKLWPSEHWINLGKALAQQKLFLALPWAGAAELARARHIANTLDNAIVLPQLSIAQLALVIAQAKAAVGVDTGLSHLAAALNIPTVAIYTDTNPKLTGVMASLAPAINLGGVAQVPSVAAVMRELTTMALTTVN